MAIKVIVMLIESLKIITFLIRPLLDCIEAAIFRFIYGKHKDLPPVTNSILMLSTTQLAEQIRKKKVRCETVMEAYKDRILEVNPFLNAIVDQRFDEAMKEAKAVDDFLRSNSKPEDQIARDTPLLGVPFTCKEAIAMKGLYQTSGLVERKDTRADKDAEIVRLYRKAGAIPLANTNIPELCMWFESGNRLYGVTNNPHDLHRTCGGSSGGEGALIAAAGGVLGIGNDLGGSIRIPAMFNGIFGHKPTAGVISNKGMYPPIDGKVNDMWQSGPMCRYAEDLLTVMKSVAGDQERLHLNETVELKNVTFFYMEDDGSFLNSATVDIKNAVKKAANHFKNSLGAKVINVNIPELKLGYELWQCKYVQSNPPLMTILMADFKGRVRPLWELFKWFLGCSNHTLPAIIFAATEDRSEDDAHFKMLETLNDLDLKMTDMLKENAVFLYPTQPESAHRHHMGISSFSNVAYTSVFNALGYPGTQIPTGLSKGLPIGIQAIAGKFNDRLTIATAAELEKVFQGWISPCPIILKED